MAYPSKSNRSNRPRPENLNYKFRRNEYIRASEVRVIDEEGTLLGIMTPAEALKIAREQELDLVEIAPTITPPVCKIISWSKFKYEYSKKQKGTQQKAPQMREMWFKPRTDVGGVDFKIKKVIKFLKDKDKVKITIKQGRDRRLDKSFYFEQINKIMESLSEYADIETPPKLEGRNVYAIIKGKK